MTRTFVIACALFTLFFGIQGGFAKLGLSYQVLFLSYLLSFFTRAVIPSNQDHELFVGVLNLVVLAFASAFWKFELSFKLYVFGNNRG